MAKNFPNMGRDLDIQVQEANQSPQNFNTRQSSPRHFIIKLSNIKEKERIFKTATEKNFHGGYQWISW